jgi:hypothetical protein
MALDVPNIRGAELAEWLAQNMNNLEFELLIRKRIEREVERIHAHNPNLYIRHTHIYMHKRGDEALEWHVDIGENYDKSASQKGEVLSTTAEQCCAIMRMRDENKISGLLEAPATVTE